MVYTLQEPDIQQDPDKYSRCRHKYSMFFGGISQGNAMRIRKNNSVIVNYGGITGEHTDRWNIYFFYYVWLFFLLSVFGWIWEEFIYLFKDDIYVNRGFLAGPWLPIYGSGGIMLELLFHRWRDKPVMTFVSSMVLCTILEYMVGWYLELTWGVKWWDYTGMPWNLHGRICVISSLLFGLGGMLLVWVISPLFYSFYLKVPAKARISLGLAAIALFTADAAYSAIIPNTGAGITYR